jgi:hypothetical protein
LQGHDSFEQTAHFTLRGKSSQLLLDISIEAMPAAYRRKVRRFPKVSADSYHAPLTFHLR